MENWNQPFNRKVSFLTDPYCQFRGVGMHEADLTISEVSIFQGQWDRCDQQNHQT